MTQIATNSKIPAIIASLQVSEGINQRAELAAVIGSPTVATDAVAVQVTALQVQKEALIALNYAVDQNNSTIKQNVVTALTTRGIVAIVSETWSSLVSKMNKSANVVAGNIKSGVTIDNVTGTYTNSIANLGGVNFLSGTGTTDSSGILTVTGLPFTPRTIMVYVTIGTNFYQFYYNPASNHSNSNGSYVLSDGGVQITTGNAGSPAAITYSHVFALITNGFTAHCYTFSSASVYWEITS